MFIFRCKFTQYVINYSECFTRILNKRKKIKKSSEGFSSYKSCLLLFLQAHTVYLLYNNIFLLLIFLTVSSFNLLNKTDSFHLICVKSYFSFD